MSSAAPDARADFCTLAGTLRTPSDRHPNRSRGASVTSTGGRYVYVVRPGGKETQAKTSDRRCLRLRVAARGLKVTLEPCAVQS